MTLKILFAATENRWAEYEAPLNAEFQRIGLSVTIATEMQPEEVDYIIYAPNSSVQDFSPYSKLKAVLNLWAGVEHVVNNPTLKVPLTRMVDHGLTRGMIEWVTGHVLRYHLGMDRYIHGLNGKWDPVYPPLARDRRVTVLGLGALGRECAQTLARLGFSVSGWSQSAKDIDGITCHHGPSGLREAMTSAEILVLLLPNTPETENLLNAERLSFLPQGAYLLNPGRGTLIDDDALLNGLDQGQVAHATLDVFRVEPLPKDHPYWRHSKVTITPHIAAETRAQTASEVVVENIRRSEAREPLLHLVDVTRGY
ncbi:MAG: 2-hydroxyacid dehydrogenase [Arenibacterium sp.]